MSSGAKRVDLAGAHKAAVLLVQMGSEKSARVLAQLRDSEVEEITSEIMRLRSVEQDVADSIVNEFYDLASAHKYAGQGGLQFAKDMLTASLGESRAQQLLSRLQAAISEMPFQFLRRADPRQVLSFLQDEHPQTIALVLAHMPVDQASMILSGLSPQLQADVAHRIAVMDRTSPDIVRQVDETLQRRLSSVLQPTESTVVGGLEPLAEIINRVDRGTERQILEGLDSLDKSLAEQVRARMFTFEDIVTLEDKAVQLVLRQVETSDLATALKGAADDVRDKIMRNLSERASENLADEIEMLGAVRLKVVEESQSKIVAAIRSLEESGQIVIQRGSDDEFVT